MSIYNRYIMMYTHNVVVGARIEQKLMCKIPPSWKKKMCPLKWPLSSAINHSTINIITIYEYNTVTTRYDERLI